MGEAKKHEKKKSKTTDIDDLFSSEEVEGYTIKSFSLGDIVELTPWFQKVAFKFSGREEKVEFSDLSTDKILGLLSCLEILPEIPEFLSIVLKEDIKAVESFDLDKAQKIILSIAVKNLDYLKNSFALVRGLIGMLTKKEA